MDIFYKHSQPEFLGITSFVSLMRIPFFQILPNLEWSVVSFICSQEFVAQTTSFNLPPDRKKTSPF
jgi:hypothetical protein